MKDNETGRISSGQLKHSVQINKSLTKKLPSESSLEVQKNSGICSLASEPNYKDLGDGAVAIQEKQTESENLTR